MLASEEHHMKTHKNQQLLTMPSPLGPLLEPCARGQTSVPEGQKPLERPCMRRLVREVCSQSIDCKALSWGIIRKPTCILAEITIRKSQSLIFQRSRKHTPFPLVLLEKHTFHPVNAMPLKSPCACRL